MTKSALWYFSTDAGLSASTFSGSGSGFSDDDGVWGASDTDLVADGQFPQPNDFYGIGNFDCSDACSDFWANGSALASDGYKSSVEFGAVPPVPLPATLPLMLGAFGAASVLRRKRMAS